FVTGSPRAQVGLRDEGSATPARPLDGYRARHAVLVGSVRSHAIVFVTPEVRRAHALLRAAVSASRSVAPSTARHALLPPNSMHTSQRTPPAWRLVYTTKAPRPTSAASASHEVHFTPAQPAQRVGLGGSSRVRHSSTK